MEVRSREDNGRDNNRGNSEGHRMDRKEERHYYRDGRWYKHDSRGNEIVVSTLSVGALINSLPPRHTTVVVKDISYYHDDNYYYMQHSNGGYVIVAPPVIVQPRPQNNYDNRGERGSDSRNERNRGGNH